MEMDASCCSSTAVAKTKPKFTLNVRFVFLARMNTHEGDEEDSEDCEEAAEPVDGWIAHMNSDRRFERRCAEARRRTWRVFLASRRYSGSFFRCLLSTNRKLARLAGEMHQTDTPSFDFFKEHWTAVRSAKCVGGFQHELLYLNDRDDLCLLFSIASLRFLEIRLWAPREFHTDLYERSVRLCNALRANNTLEGLQVVAEEPCVDIMSRTVFDLLPDKIHRFWGDPQPCALLRDRTSVLERLTIDSHDSHNFSDLYYVHAFQVRTRHLAIHLSSSAACLVNVYQSHPIPRNETIEVVELVLCPWSLAEYEEWRYFGWSFERYREILAGTLRTLRGLNDRCELLIRVEEEPVEFWEWDEVYEAIVRCTSFTREITEIVRESDFSEVDVEFKLRFKTLYWAPVEPRVLLQPAEKERFPELRERKRIEENVWIENGRVVHKTHRTESLENTDEDALYHLKSKRLITS